jgi:predicted adenine nucleotide alpha hydrolase (AANH) superfamily ATPase
VESVFLNPNIYPMEELEKRWQTYKEWGDSVGLPTERVDIPHETWRSQVTKVGSSRPERCERCYLMRFQQVALIAKEKGYDAFTTSLLVSPYQEHDALKRSLKIASEENGVPFLYQDFRPGYKRGREMARGAHLYMQKYCGCEFSQRGE